MLLVKLRRNIDALGVSDTHGDAHNRVVPSCARLTWVDELVYEKIWVETEAEYHRLVDETLKNWGPCSLFGPTDQFPCEAVRVRLGRSEKFGVGNHWTDTIFATDHSVFVMNEKGDTVDRVVAASPECCLSSTKK